MEQINKVINAIAKQEGQPPARISSELTTRYSPRRENNKRLAEILFIIGYVENQKQIHLSDDERTALLNELDRTELPISRIKKLADNVMRNKDYARIPFDVWVQSEPLYTREEAIKLADEKIELRKRQYEEMNFDEEQLAREGLLEIAVIYQRKKMLYLEKIMGNLKKRVKKAERFIKSAPEELKEEILDIAAGNNLIDKTDPHWRQILHYTAPNILDDIEKLMKRV